MQGGDGYGDKYALKERNISREDEQNGCARNVAFPYLLHLQVDSDDIVVDDES